jgi:hypothetical protein
LRQATSVASETDSESCGTLTSTCMVFSFVASDAAYALPSSGRIHASAARRAPSAARCAAAGSPRPATPTTRPGVRERLVGAHVAQQVVLDAVPGALVARLFLRPHDALRVRVGSICAWNSSCGNGIELLDAHDRDVVDAALGALGGDVVVHLAGAEDHALHLLRGDLLDLGMITWKPPSRGRRSARRPPSCAAGSSASSR